MENRPKHLLESILEGCIIFALSAYLLKLGICWIFQIRIPLIIIAVIMLIGIIVWRLYRYYKKQQWRDDDDST